MDARAGFRRALRLSLAPSHREDGQGFSCVGRRIFKMPGSEVFDFLGFPRRDIAGLNDVKIVLVPAKATAKAFANKRLSDGRDTDALVAVVAYPLAVVVRIFEKF